MACNSRYRMQRGPKDNQTPFATAHRLYMSPSSELAKIMEHRRMQVQTNKEGIASGTLSTFGGFAKGLK
jgi:hypothetical protein